MMLRCKAGSCPLTKAAKALSLWITHDRRRHQTNENKNVVAGYVIKSQEVMEPTSKLVNSNSCRAAKWSWSPSKQASMSLHHII